ncbi:MAG: efflux RND transporter periplasmic adaptor subunit [Thermoguttaceae bacterium]|nr:efflux RND transporter periplasmic adaptor subunit [Thermoguttaceae bacterium]MDW8037092.1 efflux RND transporter periplasmic adaptor subunit [Thermoguttaceae bacterium]
MLSVGFTGVLLGALVGAGVIFRTFSEKLEDVEFLRQRLKSLEPPSGPAQVKPALVRVGRAVQKPVQPNRTLVGRLVEVRRVVASSEVSGKIVDFPLEEGLPVQAGKTILARIDDIWARLALEQQQAQWLSTAAQLEFEKGELRRLEELFKAAAVTESELHQKQTQIAQLEAKLQELQATMAQEHERQRRSTVYAPFDGVVVAKHAELGQYVQPGSPLVEIISRGQIDAQLMVPESAVNRLQLDQTLSIFVDPLGEEVQGKVVSITPFGPTASRTFPVRVRIDNPTGRLKVGMSITARIPTGAERLALVVPKDAVLERPDEAIVWVVVPEAEAAITGTATQISLSAKTLSASSNADRQPPSESNLPNTSPKVRLGSVHPVPVTIDIRLPTEYAVSPQTDQGPGLLRPGCTVVIEGGERLTPGQKVQIIP